MSRSDLCFSPYCSDKRSMVLKKTAMNPFHTAHTPIRSAVFDSRVRASAKKHL